MTNVRSDRGKLVKECKTHGFTYLQFELAHSDSGPRAEISGLPHRAMPCILDDTCCFESCKKSNTIPTESQKWPLSFATRQKSRCPLQFIAMEQDRIHRVLNVARSRAVECSIELHELLELEKKH